MESIMKTSTAEKYKHLNAMVNSKIKEAGLLRSQVYVPSYYTVRNAMAQIKADLEHVEKTKKRIEQNFEMLCSCIEDTHRKHMH